MHSIFVFAFEIILPHYQLRKFHALSTHNGDVMSFKEIFEPVEFKISANRQDLNLKIEDGRIFYLTFYRSVFSLSEFSSKHSLDVECDL